MGTERNVVVVVPPWSHGGSLLAILLVAAVAMAAWVAYRRSTKPQSPALRPAPDATSIITQAIGELRAQSRLVVLHVDVVADVRRSSEKRWGPLDFGTTTVWMRVPGRVQYVIDLEQIGPDAIEYNADQKKLLVRLPAPRLDHEMVSVESDPTKSLSIRKIGWARLDRFSGRFVEDQTRRELHAAMIAAGEQAWVRECAERAARAQIKQFVAKIVTQLGSNVTIELELDRESRGP